MRVQVIKPFIMSGKKYQSGDFVNVTNEQAKRLIALKVIKFQCVPVAHKMIMSPKEVKS